MHKLYHISFVFPGVPKMRDLESAFSDFGDDWIRVGATVWVIWTQKSGNEIYFRLLPLLDQHDNFLVTTLEASGTAGRLPAWAWTWMNSKVPNTVAVTLPALPPPQSFAEDP